MSETSFRSGGEVRGAWTVCTRRDPEAALRLFCFPYAGGGISIYPSWCRRLPVSIEVHAVQLPGRDHRFREVPYTNLTALAADLSAGLEPLLHKPYAFFGHSMGALIAFETARALRRKGVPGPVHLIVSGMRAPHLPLVSLPIHDLPDDLLIEALRHLRGTPQDVLNHQDLMSLLIPMLRADLMMCERYSYLSEDPLDCALSVYGGMSDGLVSPEELLAWKGHATGPFTVRSFPGDHFYLRPDQSESLLLLAINRDLASYV